MVRASTYSILIPGRIYLHVDQRLRLLESALVVSRHALTQVIDRGSYLIEDSGGRTCLQEAERRATVRLHLGDDKIEEVFDTPLPHLIVDQRCARGGIVSLSVCRDRGEGACARMANRVQQRRRASRRRIA